MSMGLPNACGPCLDFFSSKKAVVVGGGADNSAMHSKLMAALRQKKEQLRQTFKQEMTFTRVLLKLGTVRTLMRDIRVVFDERDIDNSGHIDMSEMSQAMKALKVNLSEDEVKTLFKMADFYEDKQLTLKQFLVVLAIGYVLDAIPDLLEREGESDPGGRRHSNFHNKERIVRDALELCTYAYLMFDKDCAGVISRDQVTSVIAEQGQNDASSMSVLSQERWEEMDWDSNGDISFGEFAYAFTKWADIESGDEDTVEHMNAQNATDAARQGGMARRKSSTSMARRTSAKAKEIGRRLSSALLPGVAVEMDGSLRRQSNNNSTNNVVIDNFSCKEQAHPPFDQPPTTENSPPERKKVGFNVESVEDPALEKTPVVPPDSAEEAWRGEG